MTKKQLDAEKHIDEVTSFDSHQRAKDTIEYEQMLMKYVEQTLTNQEMMEF